LSSSWDGEAREHGAFLDGLRPLEMMSKDDKNDRRNPTEYAKAVATEAGILELELFWKTASLMQFD